MREQDSIKNRVDIWDILFNGIGFQNSFKKQTLYFNPIIEQMAAISVGINQEGQIIADLNYDEDSSCKTDMNIVMTKSGKFIEIQGTAEETPFSMEELQSILSCATSALQEVYQAQVRS